MLHALSITTLAFMVAVAGDPPPTQAPTPTNAAVAQSLAAQTRAIRARHALPALIVAVVTKDGVESIAADGVRKQGESDAIAADDRMHLGSCTKAFTATLCASLVASEKLKWSSTVGDVLGGESANMTSAWKSVTLEELLRHRGGAPADPDPIDWQSAWQCNDAPEKCRQIFVDKMLTREPAPTRGKFVYSNQGYAIVGRMCEVAGGGAYETLLRDRVLTPLGIDHAGFGPPSTIQPKSPKGHNEKGEPIDTDNPAAIAPAGRLHMPLGEWAKFVAFHLGAKPPATLEGAAKELEHLHASPNQPEGEALGWIAVMREWGGRVLTHSGSNTQWYCVAWLAPEKGFAVLAATNQGGAKAQRACDEACAAAIGARQSP